MRALLLLFLAPMLLAEDKGARAEYIGGTVASISKGEGGLIQTTDPIEMRFHGGRARLAIRYEVINLIEYGQNVGRRFAAAVLVSPVFLLSKKRKHFLTIGYQDQQGRQQAAVFRVNKNDIRTVLVSLEAKTGRKVQYQDDEARKAGKG